MLKRLLIALCISFATVQAAQACSTCAAHNTKEADKAHDHDHGEEGHSHDTPAVDTPDVAKAALLKMSGTFTQVKKAIQFTATDGKVYILNNKKMVGKITPLLGKKVDVTAKTKTSAKNGKLVINWIKSVALAK